MARAKLQTREDTTEVVSKVVTTVNTGVTLELTMEEAYALRNLIGGGVCGYSPVISLLRALESSGVRQSDGPAYNFTGCVYYN